MPGLPLTPTIHEELALDVLERVLMELLQIQGFAGGSFHSEMLTLEEVAARDGGLPLFVAQAAVWAELMGVPHIVAPFDLATDDAALASSRAVIRGLGDSGEHRVGAPLLLFINHAVHLARAASAGPSLALETLTHAPRSSISDALSVRTWPAPRAT
jgi:hypothetical protein